MSDEEKFWAKAMFKKGLFWKMVHPKKFAKICEKRGLDPENAPEMMKILQAKKQWLNDMGFKGWKGHGRRHGRHGHGGPHIGPGGPMRRFFRMMMGGRGPHC